MTTTLMLLSIFFVQRASHRLAKKASRTATEGLVHAYIHAGGKAGVLLEVNCETDFVAKTDDFKNLVHDVCMHIAASGPEYVSEAEVPEDVVAKERAVQLQRVLKKASSQGTSQSASSKVVWANSLKKAVC